MDMLVSDMLVAILGRLRPRSLAVCRCVCKAWRATVDEHRLLRADLLPLSLDGVICEGTYSNAPVLYSHPSMARKIKSSFEYLSASNRNWNWIMYDCRNGLLLLHDRVVNPATQQWARLPRLPTWCSQRSNSNSNRYLLYDPAVSPHYEVLITRRSPGTHNLGWPSSPDYIIHVFSSKTGCWTERSLVREGDATITVCCMAVPTKQLHQSAYWQGALYAQCEPGYIFRIKLSYDKYQIIKWPGKNRWQPHLGKSKKGVYCALHERGIYEIWFLDESCDQMEWVLLNQISLEHMLTSYLSAYVEEGPWILQSRRCQVDRLLQDAINLEHLEDNNKSPFMGEFGWDDGNTTSTADWPRESKDSSHYHVECLGFHPHEEIVLFNWSADRALAFHFNISRIRYLGAMTHTGPVIPATFAYATCLMRDLPGSN